MSNYRIRVKQMRPLNNSMKLVILCLVLMGLSLSPLYAQPRAPKVPGDVLVKYKENRSVLPQNPLEFIADKDTTLSAVFEEISLEQVTLTVEATNSSADVNPNASIFNVGATVTLAAVSPQGYVFNNWTGDVPAGIEYDNPLMLTMSTTRTVTAVFVEEVIGVEQYLLTVNGINGSVMRDPGRAIFAANTTVTLTATPDIGYHFTGWSGASTSTLNPLMITMDSTKIITANFALITYELNLNIFGDGSVSRIPNETNYSPGTKVSLSARANYDSVFTGWTGDIPSGSEEDNPLSLTMDSTRTLTVHFIELTTESIIYISTLEDLQKIGHDPAYPRYGWYVMTSDIDAAATRDMDGGKGFTPIGPLSREFTGRFDGKGYAVRNLYINRPTENYIGMFGRLFLGGEVRNLGIENVDITGQNHVGALAGNLFEGSVSTSYATGSIKGHGNFVGGLIGGHYNKSFLRSSFAAVTVDSEGDYYTGGLTGINYEGSIISSFATGDVTSTGQMIGGLVGGCKMDAGIRYCYALGNVYGGGDYAGGIVGYNFSGSLSNCYSIGTVLGRNMVGGAVGDNYSGATVSNCFWDKQTSKVTSSDGGTGMTTAQMMQMATFTSAGWDFSKADGDPAVWTIQESKEYPQLALEEMANKLTVNTLGNGSISFTPKRDFYSPGTIVTLTATPAEGYHFAGWTGAIFSADNPLVLTMDAQKTLTANFICTYELTVGLENGSVSIAPEQSTYYHGETVTITATPADGYHFTGWSGASTSTLNPLMITMDSTKTLSALFEINTYNLQVTSAHGSIAINPNTAFYEHGTTVSLGAFPHEGWRLVGWKGSANPYPTLNPLLVTMDANMEIEAIWTTQDSDGHETTITLPGDVPLVLVKIPEGTFMMGSPDDEHHRQSNEGIQHEVTLTHDFYMGKYEVTKAQWTAVMGTTPWSGQPNILNAPNSPATHVSWNDINGTDGFLDKMNEHLGNTGQPYRLPSEAEWEYACRANTTTRFYWGDDSNYTEINDYAWWRGNAFNTNHKYAQIVGQKLPNALGLYDMSGNVWEWCQDWYGSASSGAQTDPTGPTSGSFLVFRGGGWDYEGGGCRSARRTGAPPDGRVDYLGFRLVWDVNMISTYTLNVSHSNGGEVILQPDHDWYEEGTTVTLMATPDTGYHFTGWSGASTSTLNPLMITMDSTKTLLAQFSINTYELHVTAEHGAVNIDPNEKLFEHGATVSLSATPAVGFHFNGWTGDVPDGAESDNPLVLVLTTHTILTANFTMIEYEVHVGVEGYGSVVCSPEMDMYPVGSTITLTAMPDEHHHFMGWLGDVTSRTTMMNPLSVTADAPTSIVATFAIDNFPLVAMSDEGGSVTLSSYQGTYDFGTTVTITAIPDAGHHFLGWSGATTSTVSPLIVEINSSTTLVAHFALTTHSLSVGTINGSVGISPEYVSYDYGTTVVLVAIPDEGYVFDGWVGDIPTSDTYSTTITMMMDSDKSIEATFSLAPVTLDLIIQGDGKIFAYPYPPYVYGTTVTLSPVYASDAIFSGWTGDVDPAHIMDDPLIIVLSGDSIITANYTPIVTLRLNTNGDGSLDVDAMTTYTIGSEVIITATPNNSMMTEFNGWTGDAPTGNAMSNPITIIMDGDKSLMANFIALGPWSVDVIAENGSVDMSPLQMDYAHMSSVELLATPDSHYSFAGWIGDIPSDQEMTNPISITMDNDKTIAPTFVIDEHTVTLDAMINGSVNVTPSASSYAYGTTITLTGTPNEDYLFSNWTGDIEDNKRTNPLSMVVTDDLMIGANFVMEPTKAIYSIMTKDCSITGDPLSGLIINTDGNEASIKITFSENCLPEGVILNNGIAPDLKKNNVMGLEATLIDSIHVNGDLKKFYSQCPIGSLIITGSLKSLTMKDAHVNSIWVGGLGTIKISANVDSTSEEPILAILDMQVGTLYGKPSKITLQGTILHNLSAEGVSISKLLVSTKAYRDSTTKAKYIAYGSIEGGDIVATEIKTLSVKGGDILPKSLRTTSLSKSMKIMGTCTPFTVGARSDLLKTFEGADLSGTIDVNTSKLQVILKGGDLLAHRIHATGEINKILALTKYYIGGRIGTINEPYTLFVSGTDATQSKRGMKNIMATTGIAGQFMSGAKAEIIDGEMVFTPTFEASVGAMTTRNGLIEGEAWSMDKIFMKGNGAGFVEHSQ